MQSANPLRKRLNDNNKILERAVSRFYRKKDNAEWFGNGLDAESYYDWTIKYRKVVEGHAQALQFLPMWIQIYKDDFEDMMLLLARQTGKTTYAMGRPAFNGTSKYNHVTTYVTFSDESLATMSKDKYRFGVLQSNPLLASMVTGPMLGEVHKVVYTTGSRTNLVTHAHEWSHVVGKSVDELLADESQDLDWHTWNNANETQSWTHGKIKRMGIGGYIDSPYHDFWKESSLVGAGWCGDFLYSTILDLYENALSSSCIWCVPPPASWHTKSTL